MTELNNEFEITSSENEFAFDEEAELEKLFAADVASIEEYAVISEDLEGFAKGFPDWDLHPMIG